MTSWDPIYSAHGLTRLAQQHSSKPIEILSGGWRQREKVHCKQNTKSHLLLYNFKKGHRKVYFAGQNLKPCEIKVQKIYIF